MVFCAAFLLVDGRMTPVVIGRRNSRTDSATLPDGVEALESFAVALYSEAVNVLLALINRYTPDLKTSFILTNCFKGSAS